MRARRYETLCLLHPDLSPEDLEEVQQKFLNLIDQMGGRLIRLDDWGRRKLAYPVQNQMRGHYFLMDYMGQPELMMEIERQFKIDERAFKFLTLVLDKQFDEEKYTAERERLEAEEERRRAEAEAEARRLAEEASAGEEAPAAAEGASESAEESVS